MPVQVQGPDGQTYQFPDGTDKAAAIGYFKKKGIGVKAAAPAPRKDGPEARTAGNYLKEGIYGVGRGLRNVGEGLIGPEIQAAQNIRHPIQSAKDMQAQADASADAIKKSYRESASGTSAQRAAATTLGVLENAPMVGGLVQHAEQGGTDLASPEGVGAAAEGITTIAAPEVAGMAAALAPRAAEGITGTGPRAVRDVVTKTQDANKAGEAKAGEAKAVEQQRGDLGKKVQHGSEELRARIETSRNNALKEGNEKYNAVNEKLNPINADMGDVVTGYLDASDRIKGTEKEPAVLKSIGERIEKGDELTYEDLQGYYSEMNRELSKGTLPGDEYAALDKMQEHVGNEMQRIADSQGAGEQLAEARTYWRRMKQTFGKPQSVRDVANRTLSSVSPEFVKRDALDNRVRLLSHYDPEIGRAASEVTGARDTLKNLPKAKPTEFTPKRVGPEEVQKAKREALQRRSDMFQHKAIWIAAGPPLYAIVDMLRGHAPNLGEAAGVSAGIGALSVGVGKLLSSPKVVDFLTKATPRDAAAIPPDLRGDFPRIVQEAQKRGVKVSPSLVASFMGALAPRKPDVETGTSGRQPSNETMPGGTGDLSALPAPLQRVAETAKIVKGKPTATYGKPDIATVDDDPNTITVRDPSRMEPQVMAHEYKHLLDRNLAPGFRAQFPPDDPNNPYLKVEDLNNLPAMRSKGMTLKNLPEEKQAQLQNAWIQYQKDPEMRKILQPWVQDMNSYPMSNVLPTDADQKGINTTPRSPAPPDYAFQPAPRNATDAWQGVEQ